MRACFYNQDGEEVGVVSLRPNGNAAVTQGSGGFRSFIADLNVVDLDKPDKPLIAATDGRRYIKNLWPYGGQVEA